MEFLCLLYAFLILFASLKAASYLIWRVWRSSTFSSILTWPSSACLRPACVELPKSMIFWASALACLVGSLYADLESAWDWFVGLPLLAPTVLGLGVASFSSLALSSAFISVCFFCLSSSAYSLAFFASFWSFSSWFLIVLYNCSWALCWFVLKSIAGNLYHLWSFTPVWGMILRTSCLLNLRCSALVLWKLR